MRLVKTSACIMAIAMLGLCSCNNRDMEDENATIVNVEKGVTSPVWTSDGAKQAEEELYDQPAGMDMDGEETDSIMQTPAEETPALTETKKVQNDEITDSEE